MNGANLKLHHSGSCMPYNFYKLLQLLWKSKWQFLRNLGINISPRSCYTILWHIPKGCSILKVFFSFFLFWGSPHSSQQKQIETYSYLWIPRLSLVSFYTDFLKLFYLHSPLIFHLSLLQIPFFTSYIKAGLAALWLVPNVLLSSSSLLNSSLFYLLFIISAGNPHISFSCLSTVHSDLY